MGISTDDPKVVSLSVRPLQASHLCFEVDGILADSNTHLGSPVPHLNFAAFYAHLSSFPTVAGDPSRLLYDFSEIQAKIAPFILAALRSEPKKIQLGKAINARQNAYFAKYANAADVISTMTSSYSLSPKFDGSKYNRLKYLRMTSNQQADALQNAYINDGRDGVVKTTTSTVLSNITTQGSSTEGTQTNNEALALGAVSGCSTPTSRRRAVSVARK